MESFDQFFNKMNGEMYKDVPPPVHYQLMDFGSNLTGSPINTSTVSYGLTPLTDEDMGRYAADDVVSHYSTMHNGENPLRLGKPMTDKEFKKFMGNTWD